MKAFAPLLVMLVLVPLDNLEARGQSNSARRSRSASGAICIADVPPPDARGKTGGRHSRGSRISAYSVQVGSKSPVVAQSDRAVRIQGLSMGKKHLVRIYGDGELVESFRFRFDSFATRELCLWFNTLYETWSLSDAKDGGSKCRCGSSGR